MSITHNVNLHLNDNSLCPTIIETQVNEVIYIHASVDGFGGDFTASLYPITFCGLIRNKLGDFKVEFDSGSSNSMTSPIYYDSASGKLIIHKNDITAMKGKMICELYFYAGGDNIYWITNPFIIEIGETTKSSAGNVLPDLNTTYNDLQTMLTAYKAGQIGKTTVTFDNSTGNLTIK